jgi:hypothetical protein
LFKEISQQHIERISIAPVGAVSPVTPSLSQIIVSRGVL